MRIKAMPIIGLRDRVPCPVRRFEVFKNDPRILVFFGRITPHIEVFVGKIVAGNAGAGGGYSTTRLLKPRILIGSVIDDQLRDDAQISRMRRIKECAEIIEGAEIRIDVEVIGDVVSIISQWRRIKGQEPNGGDAEFLKIIQFLDQSAKVTHPVPVAVTKRFDVRLVDDCVFVPQRIHARWSLLLRHAFNF